LPIIRFAPFGPLLMSNLGRYDAPPALAMKHESALIAVKLLHTAIWAFFVACIFGAPLAAAQGRFKLSAVLIALVAVEALVLHRATGSEFRHLPAALARKAQQEHLHSAVPARRGLFGLRVLGPNLVVLDSAAARLPPTLQWAFEGALTGQPWQTVSTRGSP
jgi:hypothetical protein